jgi:HAD superfamily hydrolase (TIGR01509 family)
MRSIGPLAPSSMTGPISRADDTCGESDVCVVAHRLRARVVRVLTSGFMESQVGLGTYQSDMQVPDDCGVSGGAVPRRAVAWRHMPTAEAPTAVLIDLYDTLVWGEWPGLRDTMAARIGISSAALQSAFDSTRPSRGVGSFAGAEEDMASVLEACGLDPEPGLVGELLELERSSLLTRIHLFDDSIPVLRALRVKGVRTALVSNCSRSTRPVVDDLGLEREMDAVVLSFEVGAAKPDAAIYRAALDRLGAEPAAAAFVDDQSVYCDGAAALGLRTYLIQRDASLGDGVSTDGHTLIPDLAALLA